jgi:acyl-CoA synthetase (AMP-forming)/AMP-acid ligase II
VSEAGPGRSTLGRLLLERAAADPDRIGVAYPDVALTFAQLLNRSRSLAKALTKAGVGAGARVGVFLPNCLEYIDLVFAASLVGAQLVRSMPGSSAMSWPT